MSRVANTKIVGQVFKPIVTDLTYNELDNIREKNQSINITNSIIFSVPIKTDISNLSESNNVEDIAGEASIWITDYNGNLQPITFPYNKLNNVIKYYEEHIINNDTKVVASVGWNSPGQIIQSSMGSMPLIDTNIRLDYTNGKFDIVRASSLKIYVDEYGTPYSSSTQWYNQLINDEPTTYYIKGIVPFENKQLETSNYIQCTIIPISKELPEITYNSTINTNAGKITIIIQLSQSGNFYLNCESNLTASVSQNSDRIWAAGSTLIYEYVNNTDEGVIGEFTYVFTPANTNKYTTRQESFTTDIVPKPKPLSPYYFYIGTTRINSSSTIGTPVGNGEAGWHLIGNSLDNINVSNKALDTSDQSNLIILDPTYSTANGVDFYVVIPNDLNIYDGLGNNLNSNYESLGTFNLLGNTYKIFKIHDYEFIFNIY